MEGHDADDRRDVLCVFPEDWGDFDLSQVALWRRALSELPPLPA
jgi:hypothetical protein